MSAICGNGRCERGVEGVLCAPRKVLINELVRVYSRRCPGPRAVPASRPISGHAASAKICRARASRHRVHRYRCRASLFNSV